MKCTATCAYGFSATKQCTSSLHLILYGLIYHTSAGLLVGERSKVRWSLRLPK